MPKFFRNIRIKSIELSKVKNYLLYAIGEIILVAIGILLALQVSNWNEERNNDVKRKKYYKNLLVELRKDSDRIINHKEYLNGELKNINDFTEYSKRQLNTDSLLNNLYKIAPFYKRITSFKTATYETLIATGDIKLINDSIVSSLYELIDTQKTYLTFSTSNGAVWVNMMTETAMRFPDPRFSAFANPTKVNELVSKTDKGANLLVVNQVVYFKSSILSVQLIDILKLQELNASLIDEIEQLQKK
jgi:hypothetical protein